MADEQTSSVQSWEEQVKSLRADVANLHRIVGSLQNRQKAVEGLIGLLGIEVDEDELAERCLDIVMEAVGVESGSILLHDSEENVLRFIAARGPCGDAVKQFTVQVGQGIAGWCFEQNQPVAVSDVEKDERFSREISEAIGYQVRSLLAAPLQSGGRPRGVLELINKTASDEFVHDDVELAAAAARIIGLLLENRRHGSGAEA